MRISEFIDATKFNLKKIVDFNKMTVDHFMQEKKESEIEALTEDTYNDLIKFLSGRLKLTKRFVREDEHLGTETREVYIASGKELGEMLDTFTNTLTNEQRQKTIAFFTKK